MDLPFVQSAENNKAAILAAIAPYLDTAHRVLEVGAGTGQHAVHFAQALPQLTWLASEHVAALSGLMAWQVASALPNLPPPLTLDIASLPWACAAVDAVYTANVLHFMPADALPALFAGAAGVLRHGGWLLVYGPFHRSGQPPTPGNAALDAWLAAQDPRYAIRTLDSVLALAAAAGFAPVADHALPANNHLLAWQRD